MSDTDRDDKYVAAASQLATEVRPERDLWPGIAEGIAPRRGTRWMPMLAQAAVVVLLVGGSSGLTFLAMKDDQPPAQVITPDLLFETATFSSGYALGP